MAVNKEIYYGYILKGDLHGALGYIKRFAEQAELYRSFMMRFEQEQYTVFEIDALLNAVLLDYQRYYRNVFYLCMDKEQAAKKLSECLQDTLGIKEKCFGLCEIEGSVLTALFHKHGFSFQGGKTSGYYGPYIWRTTETAEYTVELPNGTLNYSVKLLDGFLSRSWMDYLSFGEIGSGGWTDNDGCIQCVKSAWDFESEAFRISLLKHEAQHIQDLQKDREMSSVELEYRAKLVELIYSNERNLLRAFAQEASLTDMSNAHAVAAYQVIKGFQDFLCVEQLDLDGISVEITQSVAKALFEYSNKSCGSI